MPTDLDYTDFVSARWSSLYRFSYLLAGSHAAADDLLQNALLRVYLKWDKVTRADVPESYVHRMLVNEHVSQGRRAWRRRELATDEPPELATGSHEVGAVDQTDLWRLVHSLPPRQRAVIVLRYYEDLSEAEIARVLDCSQGTVKSQASAAMRSLRSAYLADGEA